MSFVGADQTMPRDTQTLETIIRELKEELMAVHEANEHEATLMRKKNKELHKALAEQIRRNVKLQYEKDSLQLIRRARRVRKECGHKRHRFTELQWECPACILGTGKHNHVFGASEKRAKRQCAWHCE